ncbi:MAG TPA: CDP-diacylglycerol--glycerol-3-phosphate 3-phosphatidyltransferase [Opitutaceae bacterium]|nr:CDP-diacylglycerol--glycerol-3-phosphate 3-phosphatidyltransferase [Opitutaceae bacterium]
MNLPNQITLSRIPLMFVIVWLMFQPWLGAPSLAFGLFVLGALSDWYDGYLARRLGIVSVFGKIMDALADKIMVLGIMVAMVDRRFHPIPLAFVLITLCREFLVSGMRMVAASKGIVVPADRGGKTKTMTQLIAIGFLLATPMAENDWGYLLARWDRSFNPNSYSDFTAALHTIGLVGFVLGTTLAVWSGWRYILQYKDVVFSEADK